MKAENIDAEVQGIRILLRQILLGFAGARTSQEMVNLSEALVDCATRIRELATRLNMDCADCKKEQPMTGYA